MLRSDLMLKNPCSQFGPCEQTNMLPSEMQEIDVTMAMAMCKVHIHQFAATTRKWNWWHYDFEVAMKGADIPRERWVAVLPSLLDDSSRDACKELTGPRRGNQTLSWTELADLFEACFQEKTDPNNVLLMLKALKFDHLEAKRVCGQQVSHRSVQTVQLSEPPLQNLTAIGGGNGQSCRPGLMLHGPHTVYVPPTELADKRQATMLHFDSMLKNPYSQLGPHDEPTCHHLRYRRLM